MTRHALLTEPGTVRKHLWFHSTPTHTYMHTSTSYHNFQQLCGQWKQPQRRSQTRTGCCYSWFLISHNHLQTVSTFPPLSFCGSLTLSQKQGQLKVNRVQLYGLMTWQRTMFEPASWGNRLYPSCSCTPCCNMSAVNIQDALGNLLSGVLLLYSCGNQRKKKNQSFHIIDWKFYQTILLKILSLTKVNTYLKTIP